MLILFVSALHILNGSGNPILYRRLCCYQWLVDPYAQSLLPSTKDIPWHDDLLRSFCHHKRICFLYWHLAYLSIRLTFWNSYVLSAIMSLQLPREEVYCIPQTLLGLYSRHIEKTDIKLLKTQFLVLQNIYSVRVYKSTVLLIYYKANSLSHPILKPVRWTYINLRKLQVLSFSFMK